MTTATVRIEHGGTAILFFHAEQRDGFTEAYVSNGQHQSGISRTYYRYCTHAPRSAAEKAEAARLVAEWNGQPGDASDIQLISRFNWRP
jgi:hypothetical protein